MTNPNIKKLIQQNIDEMVAFRRDLHRHPELPWEEFRTTDRIAQELDKIGIAYRRTEPTGIIAEIQGGKPGKRILLRADIDALPVQELSENIDYKSTIDGKMHACGHDTHASMLLTAAKALYEIRDQLKGNVRLVFQPAEEVAQGAKGMIKQGVLDGVDSAFGMHIWSQMPVGKISCVVGSSFASADLLTVRFKGRGGHGSMPHDTVAMYRATAEVEYIYGTLPVINDKESALLAQKVIVESFGEEALYFEAPTTGGEDFSYYTENIPGAFALVGSGNPDKDTQWPHHHGCFNVDEDGMALGAEFYAQYAWAYLNQN